MRETHLLFQETQTLSVFRSRTISVSISGKITTSWLKKFSNTGSTNVNSFTKAHLANMGWKHKMIWEEDFAFRILNLAQNEINEGYHFCKFLLSKPVLDFFLLTSMKWILTKDVDSFNPQCLASWCSCEETSWTSDFFRAIIMAINLANFARYCTSFQDRGKKCKKSSGVLSRQAKRSKIFAKESSESCIKVIHDHSSFSCNLHQICYLQPFLMNQLFFQKTHLFSKIAQFVRPFWEISLILLLSIAILRRFAAFETVQNFQKTYLFA